MLLRFVYTYSVSSCLSCFQASTHLKALSLWGVLIEDYGWQEGHSSNFEQQYHIITCHHSIIILLSILPLTLHDLSHHTGGSIQSCSVSFASFVSPNDYFKSLLAVFSGQYGGSWSHPGLELQHGFISCLKTWPFDACDNLSTPSICSQSQTINFGSISWQESLFVPILNDLLLGRIPFP